MAKTRQVTFLLGANIKNFKKGLDSAQQRMQRFGRKMKRTGRSLTRSVTLPLAAAGGAALKMASDFESSMTRIETLVGLSRTQVQGMRSDVLALSRETARAPHELSEALFTVTSAGLRGAESMEVLERAAKASAIGLGETREIARATTAIIQAYGKENINAAQATDTLTAIVREGNLEASELAPVLGRVVGIASQLGISFSEVGASIATFTRLGVSAEEAVTGLRGTMNALLKPTAEGRKALEQVGMSFEELRRQAREEGLMSTLRGLIDAFDGNVEGLSRVIPRVRALASVMGTAGAQGEEYEQILNNIQDTTGIVDEGFERVSETAQFKFNKALTALKTTAIELGAILLPLANDVLEFVDKWISKFTDLSDETKRMGLVVAGILGASGPILTALGVMLSAFAAISWPVVLGVAALGGATAAIVSHWDSVVAYFTEGGGAQLWAALKQAAKEIWGAMKGLFDSLSGLTSSFSENWGSDVTGIITKSVTIIAEAVTKIIDSMSLVINLLRGDWRAAWENFKDVATSNMKDLEEQMFLSMSSMAQSATAMTNLLTGNFKTAWEQFKFGWGIGANKFTEFLEEQQKKIQEQNRQTKEAIQKNGYGAFEPMIRGATDAAVALRNAFLWAQRLHQAGQGGGDSGDNQFTTGQRTKVDAGPKRGATGLNLFPTNKLEGFARGLEKAKVKGNELSDVMREGLWKATSNLAGAWQRFGEVMGQVLSQAILHGRELGQVLKNIGAQLASRALMKGLGLLLSGGTFQLGSFIGSIFGVNDALITSEGDVVQFHPDDNILAMQDFSSLGGGGDMGVANINVYMDSWLVDRQQERLKAKRRR